MGLGPNKRTPEVEERLLPLLRDGNTRRTASTLAGISHDTLQRWMQADASFASRVLAAEEAAVARHVGIIAEQAQKDWRAAAFWLQRRRPQDWMERKDIGIHQGDGKPVVIISPEAIPDDVLAALIASPQEADGSPDD